MLAIIYAYDLSKVSVVLWGLVLCENFRKVRFSVTFSNATVTGRGNAGSLGSFGCNVMERSSQLNLHKKMALLKQYGRRLCGAKDVPMREWEQENQEGIPSSPIFQRPIQSVVLAFLGRCCHSLASACRLAFLLGSGFSGSQIH